MRTIAVIGTGIAGMGAAYFLKNKFEITFFEKNDYPGGHTNTLTIDEEGQPVFIDSGFMVYNELTYPNLTRLFQDLQVQTKPTSMSFSVQHRPSGLDYCGTGLRGLFAQRRNLPSIKFWKMLLDMHRFNQESLEVIGDDRYEDYSLARYVKEKGYGKDFLEKFLIPISSAVWSNPPGLMEEFPIVTLVTFFKNHGFLGLRGHYQWRTVVDGSQRYRDKILSSFAGKVFLNNGVEKIIRGNGKVKVRTKSGSEKVFDQVVLACHADEALSLLEDPTPLESELLSQFTYFDNKVTLHTDESVMPRTKRAWSSWNYLIQEAKGKYQTSTVYWMNSLQQVSKKRHYFISINDPENIDPKKVLWETKYSHPVYNKKAVKAQARLPSLNTNKSVYFCGSYFRYGFHEDAFTAAIDVVREITGSFPTGYKGLRP